MNSPEILSRADIENAEGLLRSVLLDDLADGESGDAGSLQRMLAHLVNIHLAVSTSNDRNANAAKRLEDFAVTTTRMAARLPRSAAKLSRLSTALRAASARVRNSDGG